jgi:hypothetical protein
MPEALGRNPLTPDHHHLKRFATNHSSASNRGTNNAQRVESNTNGRFNQSPNHIARHVHRHPSWHVNDDATRMFRDNIGSKQRLFSAAEITMVHSSNESLQKHNTYGNGSQ